MFQYPSASRWDSASPCQGLLNDNDRLAVHYTLLSELAGGDGDKERPCEGVRLPL